MRETEIKGSLPFLWVGSCTYGTVTSDHFDSLLIITTTWLKSKQLGDLNFVPFSSSLLSPSFTVLGGARNMIMD
ncbi:unnamed protein product [Sphenostylis stenocarpa]|uniref:Uncharacterized protein n=1 Tax=Sphenostylis stenocarpa TaxID=92480 RepID=A0AA86SD82_9FABA|nr:unnamed protein product [Sphenostylis stenocarpa]